LESDLRSTVAFGFLGVLGVLSFVPELSAAPPSVSQVASSQSQGARPGVPPDSAWSCPLSQPIKGNFTPYSGARCIYHVLGGYFYGKTKPERCYATELEARSDGCRRSRR